MELKAIVLLSRFNNHLPAPWSEDEGLNEFNVLLASKLIQIDSLNKSDPCKAVTYSISEKGKLYISMLTKMPEPVIVWTDPREIGAEKCWCDDCNCYHPSNNVN